MIKKIYRASIKPVFNYTESSSRNNSNVSLKLQKEKKFISDK